MAAKVEDTKAEEAWTRTPMSDAARINAEELYLYLYEQYRDNRGEAAAAHTTGLAAGHAATQPPHELPVSSTAELPSVDHVDDVEDRHSRESPDEPGQAEHDQPDKQQTKKTPATE